jgi:uncharacterized membrane protein YhaH (DUF805 family)
MGPIEAIASVYRRWSDFSGRSTRPEFWWFFLYELVGTLLLQFLDGSISQETIFPMQSGFSPPLTEAFWLINLIPTIAVSVRRLRDAGFGSKIWLALMIITVAEGYLMDLYAMITGDTSFDDSTGYAMLVFSSLAFWLLVYVLAARRSHNSSNTHGPNPTEVTP